MLSVVIGVGHQAQPGAKYNFVGKYQIQRQVQLSSEKNKLVKLLMMEEAQAGEDHGDSKGVAGVDDILVADGTSRLGDVGDTAAACPSDVIIKGEETVACQGNACHLFQPVLFLFHSKGSGLSVNKLCHTSFPMTSS